MDTYITLKTFTFPSEAYILRSRLESEGIECFIKDELTIQSNSLNSNAIGGVKLQVKQSEIENAILVLKDGGYTLDNYDEPSKLYLRAELLTSKVPIFNKLPVIFRLLIAFVLAVLSVLVIVMFLVIKLHEN